MKEFLQALGQISKDTLVFGRPGSFYLFALPILLLIAGIVFRRRPILSTLLRTLTLATVVLALSQPAVEVKHEHKHYTAILDVSTSIPLGAIRTFLDELKPYALDTDDSVTIVPFAGKAAARSLELKSKSDLSALAQELDSMRKDISPGETNITNGLHKAWSLPDTNSVLLLSDGFDTVADARQAARVSAGKGIPIFSIVARESVFRSPSVTISSLHAPITSGAGDKVDVRISVKNTFNQPQVRDLELWLGAEKLKSERIDVPPGQEELIHVETPALTGGLQRIRAVVRDPNVKADPPEDETHRWISVKEKAKLLLLSGSSDDQRVLKELIRVRGFGVETIVADGNQEIPTNFAAFSSVIINNAGYDQLPKAFLPALEEFVKAGGGLLTVGGDRSYGLGKYIDTPLERMSPLKFVPPQTEKRRVKVAVILVIDKSGSMEEENRLTSAKEAAILSMDALKDEDYISVIGFDDTPFELFSIRTVGEARQIAERRMRSLSAAGQTNPLPALSLARQRMRGIDAGRKHLIVLSDGRFPMSSDIYADEINKLKSEGVTVSAVALGADADIPFMKFLAQAGRGAFYQTVDPSRLPKIFVEDIKVTAGEKTLTENASFPVGLGPAGVVSTTIERYPPVLGFVETLPKKGSSLELITRKEDGVFPLLASWSYERGTVVAFTSDANGRWSDPWVRWPDFAKFWGQIIEHIKNQSSQETGQVDFDLRYSVNRKTLAFELSIFDSKLQSSAAPQITAKVFEPGGEPREISFRPVQRGRFAGRLEGARPGDFKLDIKYGNLNLPPVAVTIPSEAFGEIAGKGLQVPYLEEIAYLSGGSVNPAPIQVASKVQATTARTEFFIPLLLLAFALILLEAFIREIGTNWAHSRAANTDQASRPKGRTRIKGSYGTR